MTEPKEPEEPRGAKVIDIRDRLPLRIFGDNPTGELAGKIFKLILAEGGPPHVWFSALMVTSYAYQRLLTNVFDVEPDKLRVIFAQAMEIADGMEINVHKKPGPKGA